MVSNVDSYVDPSWNYGSWLEIYNPTYTICDLRGCWISDDPNNLKKFQINHSFLLYPLTYGIISFGHYGPYSENQIDFELDKDGGVIYFSKSDGELLNTLEYPAGIPRASWARKNMSEDVWGYTNKISPGKANGDVQFVENRLDAPEINSPSCVFTSPFDVIVTIPEGATLRYTTDCSTPSSKNGKISEDGKFSISNTTVYRFVLLKDGYLSSPVVTRNFIKKTDTYTLPILSVCTDSKNLYSDELGIFVRGTNGCVGYGQTTPCNWNMDWDRPVNFEYFTPEGQSLINQEAEIRRCGKWSRASTPYSFKIHSSKVFEGKGTMDYPFFENKPYNKHKMLQIRNGGNGLNNSGRCIDPFLQSLVITSGIDIDAQEYQPVVHFINGVYKGLINMREPNNKHFVYSNYGLDDDEIDFYEIANDSCYGQLCGTRKAFNTLYQLSKTAKNEDSYDKIKDLLDIDEYCYYMAIELYLGNSDWPNNNTKCWRPREDKGRFRNILFDLDFVFYFPSSSNIFSIFEERQIYTFHGEKKEIEPVTIFLNLLQNDTFRKKFIDTFCLVAGSIYEPTRCEELIKKWTERIHPMQILYDNGYGTNKSPWDTANWLISNLKKQPNVMFSALKNYGRMKLQNVTGQNISISSNLSSASILLNGQIIPTGKFNGTLFPPLQVEAKSPEGYVFDGWELQNGSVEYSNVIFDKKGEWTYFDNGEIDTRLWNIMGYSTNKWNSGSAPLGYGSAKEGYNTILAKDKNSKPYTTYYFRKLVTFDSKPSDDDNFELEFDVDDGCIIYLNGKEVGRYNMPSSEVNYFTLSEKSVGTNPHTSSTNISGALFKKGVNVIAVEVHNSSTTSSDLYWDAKLTKQKIGSDGNVYYSNEAKLNLPKGDFSLVAHFSKETSDENHPKRIPVVINEISASNSVHVNEYYKKADWIELYNNSEEDIDLEGMYLSDDINNVDKYKISKESDDINTVIHSHGYKIIWCDKTDAISQIHAPFKLSNEDNQCIILSNKDLSLSDTLYYCAHNGRESVGRFPDGARDVYKMSHASINKQNFMSIYNSLWSSSPSKPTIVDFIEGCQGDEKMAVVCKDGQLEIKSRISGKYELSLYSLNGILLMKQTIELFNNTIHVPLSTMRGGIYVVNFTNEQGNTTSYRVMIK